MPHDLPPCRTCGHGAVHTKLAGCLDEVDGLDCPCPVYVPPTPTVVSSPTLERARAERDAAMEQVEAAASPEWIAQAEDAVQFCARRSTAFSVDDVWAVLDTRGVQGPREPRALGPVMKRALTRGLIHHDGFTQSRRRHAALIRTYTGNPS